MSESTNPSLFSDFTAKTAKDWRAKVEQDLKGKPFERLIWHTPDGIPLQPMYVREGVAEGRDSVPGQAPFRRGSVFHADEPGWQVVQAVTAGDSATERIREAILAEVSAILLEGDLTDLAAPLAEVDHSQTALHLVPQRHAESLLEDLVSWIQASASPDSHLTGTLLKDIVTNAALQGKKPEDNDWKDMISAIAAGNQFPYFRTLGIDMREAGERGATMTLQLALALAAIVEYLDRIPQHDHTLSVSTLTENLHVVFPVSGSFFLEAGKFRAFRMLVAELLSHYGLEGEGLLSPFVMARSAKRNLTRYDQHNNLLRHTTEAMSAVVGGVEAVTLDPFNVLEEVNGKTGSRLARNIQFLLKHESYLNRVQDVGGGSYYLETITEELATKAWDLFVIIEQAGGLLAFAQNGELNKLLETQAADAKNRLNKRRNILIGVNMSPNSGETRDISISEDDLRLAADFERLRAAVDLKGRKRGKRLSAYLWQFGDVRMRNARAQFSRNLLAAAGLEMMDNPSSDDVEASVVKMKELAPDYVVLCSSDDEYVSTGKDITAMVKEALPETLVVVAGKVSTLEEIGADEMIFAGLDALAFLTRLVE